MARTDGPDLLELAEDVDAGRITLRAAEARLDRETERRELRSLVRALGAVGEHAAASVGVARASGDHLEVAPARVRPVMRERITRRSILGGAAAAMATVAVVVLVIVAVQPPPLVAGPSLRPSVGASAVPSVGAAPTPVPTPVSTAAAGLPEMPSEAVAGPNLAFWSLTAPGRLATWLWDPPVTRFVERASVETWPGDTIIRTVLFAPNGAYFAIHEVDQATSSPVQRVRIFTYGGELAWEGPRLSAVTAMAWTSDSAALAIGSLPTPWTVVQLGDGSAAPDVTTYELDDEDGYALLGFSEDGNTLYGYGTGGEAEFWEKLVAVDLAKGTLRRLDAAPTGPAAMARTNSTAPVGQFNAGGEILALAGGARGDPHWVIRVGAAETPLEIDHSTLLAWSAEPDRAASLARAADGIYIREVDPRMPLVDPTRVVVVPLGGYRADLAGARDGLALVLLSPFPAGDEGVPFVVTEALLVELSTGRVAVGLAPENADQAAGFTFAGWLGRRQ